MKYLLPPALIKIFSKQGGDDATAWGPPARAEPLMPKRSLERRARPGVTPREEEHPCFDTTFQGCYKSLFCGGRYPAEEKSMNVLVPLFAAAAIFVLAERF